MKRGALIVLEGGDRAGKSTQCKKLSESLTELGIKNKMMNFPNRTTEIGRVINDYLANGVDLDDRTIHLLFTANRWEAEKKMLRDLRDGVTLIVDRYLYSGVCFSAAKQDMNIEWCINAERGLPLADIVYYMKTSSQVTSSRTDFGSERYEKIEFQEKVCRNFDKFMESEDNWMEINASLTIEEIHKEIQFITLNLLENIDDEIKTF